MLSNYITIDRIIEKIVPIIGALLMTIWGGYLLYTNIWINLETPLRLTFGFFVSLLIIWGWSSLSNKIKYFADVIIGIWVMLLYATLMYWSRTTEISQAVIPEFATLITAIIFTLALWYFALTRKSKVILTLWMLWAYLTPFAIGQVDSWSQNISFNEYLIYFAAVNIAVFFMSREFSIKEVVPLNIIWMFTWTTAIYSLSYLDSKVYWLKSSYENFLISEFLIVLMASFTILSIVFSSKKFEEKDEKFIIWGYTITLLWAFLNIISLDKIGEIENAIGFWFLSAVCFWGWHYLRNLETKSQHIGLYTGWVAMMILGFAILSQEYNEIISIAIAYTSIVFGGLYLLDSKKTERLAWYFILSFLGAAFTYINYFDVRFSSEILEKLYCISGFIPALLAYWLIKHTKNEEFKNLSIASSTLSIFMIIGIIFFDLIKNIDFSFLIFYIPVISLLFFTLKSKTLSHEAKSINLHLWIVWIIIGHLWVFLDYLVFLYPAPLNTYIFTNFEAFKDITLLKSIIATVIFFIGLALSRDLQSKQEEKRPSFVLVILGYTSVLLTINYILMSFINDLDIISKQGWIRTIITTFWWFTLSVFMMIVGIKKWVSHRSEKLLWMLLLTITVAKVLLYDMSTMDMTNKIIILMVIWWAMMWFSYIVQSKGLLHKKED